MTNCRYHLRQRMGSRSSFTHPRVPLSHSLTQMVLTPWQDRERKTQRRAERTLSWLRLFAFGAEVVGEIKLERSFLNLGAIVFDDRFQGAAADLNGNRERNLRSR